MIYLDSAATSFHKPEAAARAVYEAMHFMGNSGRGAHEASLNASRIIYEARSALSDLFHGGGPGQTVFTANATEGLNMVIQGLFSSQDHVITTMMEHNSVLRPLYRLQDQGMELTVVKCSEQGSIDYDDIEQSVKPGTRAIICTHASNVTGNLLELRRIGELAVKYGLLFIVDASQTAGAIPIDMCRLNIDVLCFTGHKSLMGPQGTGGFCVREGVRIKPLLTGGSGIHSFDRRHPADMPEALEAGTLNGHGIAGLLAAVRFIQETGIETIRERERLHMRRFYEGVKDIPGIKIYGNVTVEDRAPIIALNLGNYDSAAVCDALFTDYGIMTRPGVHCAPRMHEALKTEGQGAVRFSFSYFNSDDEITAAIEAMRKLAEDE